MNTTRFLSCLLIVCFFTACSPKNADEKPHGVLSDAQKQTLDKSKKTEELLDKANRERMKEVDEAEK
jgi:hypothetical protein